MEKLKSNPDRFLSGSAMNSASPDALQSGRRSGHAGPEREGLRLRPNASAGIGPVAPRSGILPTTHPSSNALAPPLQQHQAGAVPDEGVMAAQTQRGKGQRERGAPDPASAGTSSPAQPPALPASKATLHHLPGDLLAKVVASAAEAGLGRPEEAARQFATLSSVNRALHSAADTALHMHVEESYVTSAARLTQAVCGVTQDLISESVDTPPALRLDLARLRVAAAIRGLDHVRVDLGPEHPPAVAAAVVHALACHGGLRSLEIAVPADFHALAPLLDLLAAHPGILCSLELRAAAPPEAPVPGLDPAEVARALGAQKDTLTALNLSGTSLELKPPLSEAIASLSCLQNLNLSGMPLGASQAQALADTLRPLRALQNLDLSHSQLDVAACEHLASALEHHAQLRRLNMGSNLLGDTGAQVLGPGLATLARLESLDLSDNDIGLEGCRAIAAQLVWRVRRHKDPQATTGLRHLSLANNALGDEAAEHLSRALMVIPSLHELNFGRCQIGPAGMGKLVDALKKMPQLQSLHLHNNHLGQDGHSLLVDALRHLPNLQDLNLRSTALNANGLRTLEGALVRLRQLRHLNLSNNDLQDGFGLARVLRSMHGKLKTLSLAGINPDLSHWRELTSALGNCTELRELNLSENNLTPLIGRQLTAALTGLQHLEVLGLRSNELNDRSLSELLSKLGGLKSATVSGNDEVDLNALQGVLPHVRFS